MHVQFQKISGGDTPGPPALARGGGVKPPLRRNPGYGPDMKLRRDQCANKSKQGGVSSPYFRVCN